MSKQDFLEQPKDTCYLTLSLGEPGGGKTYVLLASVIYWLENNVFDEYYLMLPSFKVEKDKQYDVLEKYRDKVFIVTSYSTHLSKQLREKSEKAKEDGKELKIFYGLDDSTQEGVKMMKCNELIHIATNCRHLNIHTWMVMHYDAKVIAPGVRSNAKFLFFYTMAPKTLKHAFETWVNFPVDFPRFRDFQLFWYEYIFHQKYGCMHINKITKKYTPDVSLWFDHSV